jgi:hypothetical protein
MARLVLLLVVFLLSACSDPTGPGRVYEGIVTEHSWHPDGYRNSVSIAGAQSTTRVTSCVLNGEERLGRCQVVSFTYLGDTTYTIWIMGVAIGTSYRITVR